MNLRTRTTSLSFTYRRQVAPEALAAEIRQRRELTPTFGIRGVRWSLTEPAEKALEADDPECRELAEHLLREVARSRPSDATAGPDALMRPSGRLARAVFSRMKVSARIHGCTEHDECDVVVGDGSADELMHERGGQLSR